MSLYRINNKINKEFIMYNIKHQEYLHLYNEKICWEKNIEYATYFNSKAKIDILYKKYGKELFDLKLNILEIWS